MLELKANINAELGEIIFALERLGSGIFPETAKMIHRGTGIIQQVWVQQTEGVFKFPTGSYVRAIQDGAIYPVNDDPYHGQVINDSEYAGHLEEGYPAYDMKKMLNTSDQVRINKKGEKYLIIPFRHGTPRKGNEAGNAGNRATMASMPLHVHDVAKKLIMSQTISKYAQKSKQNPDSSNVAIRRKYEWGNRLTQNILQSIGANKAEIRKYSGMVKFPREQAQSSGSQYFTFRVMSENSKPGSWIHPAQPALKIAERTLQISESIILPKIQDAFSKDLQEINGTALA